MKVRITRQDLSRVVGDSYSARETDMPDLGLMYEYEYEYDGIENANRNMGAMRGTSTVYVLYSVRVCTVRVQSSKIGGSVRLPFFCLSRVVAVSSEMTDTGSSAMATELEAPARPDAKPDVLSSAKSSSSLASVSVPALGSFSFDARPNVFSAG